MSEADRRARATVAADTMTIEESQRGYSSRAKTYEEHVYSGNYTGHQIMRRRMSAVYSPSVRSTVRILDIGAGTGLVGKELKDAGFVHIDALDPNADMLQEAKDRGIYENYFIEFLTRAELDIPKGTYDAITGSGCYAKNCHMPTEAFYEMIRLVKPGGHITLVTRAEYQDQDMESLMKTLEEQGKWRIASRDIEPNYYLNQDGIAWTFRVL